MLGDEGHHHRKWELAGFLQGDESTFTVLQESLYINPQQRLLPLGPPTLLISKLGSAAQWKYILIPSACWGAVL